MHHSLRTQPVLQRDEPRTTPRDQDHSTQYPACFFGISLTTWWRWCNNGKATRGIQLTPKVIVWEGSYLLALKHQLLSETGNYHVLAGLQTPFSTSVASDARTTVIAEAPTGSGEDRP